jgi:hypothetical protein
MHVDGIYDDGWVTQSARVIVPGGDAADLVLRAVVLPCHDQHLEVRVDGDVVASQAVAAGPLDLRVPVAASPAERHVELRWAETTALNESDSREAAALLQFLNVTTQRAPAALRIPGGLSHPGAQYTGLRADGWAEQEARILLAGGPDAILVVRGQVPDDLQGQHLVVEVDGEKVVDEDAAPGPFEFRAPVRSSAAERLVELRWTSTGAVSSSDARHAAALLTFVGVTSGPPPRAIARFPDDLADPNLVQTGIHPDGWIGRQAALELAGGDAAQLVIRADIPPDLLPQHVEVSVDGSPAGSGQASDEMLDVRVALPATAGHRRIELRWERDRPVSDSDRRRAAARLRFIGLASGTAPNALGRFPADLLDPNLVHSGIYADGWLARESRAEMAGGPAARLIVRALVPGHMREQSLDVLVGGVWVASKTGVGMIDVRVDVPASDAVRPIELKWARTAPVAADDPRPAAALLDLLALTPKPAS